MLTELDRNADNEVDDEFFPCTTNTTNMFQDECKIITVGEATEGTMKADTLLETP